MSPVMYQPSRKTSLGALGLVEIAEHAVRALHQQQAFRFGRERVEGVGFDDVRGDSGERVAHRAGLAAGLRVVAGFEVRGVHGDDGRHLGAAVAFQQFRSRTFRGRRGDGLAQFLGAHQDEAQGGEFFAVHLRA